MHVTWFEIWYYNLTPFINEMNCIYFNLFVCCWCSYKCFWSFWPVRYWHIAISRWLQWFGKMSKCAKNQFLQSWLEWRLRLKINALGCNEQAENKGINATPLIREIHDVGKFELSRKLLWVKRALHTQCCSDGVKTIITSWLGLLFLTPCLGDWACEIKAFVD